MRSIKTFRDRLALRETAPAIMLLLNSFVWYLLINAIFNNIISGLNILETDKLGLLITYFAGTAVTAIIGSKLFSRARPNYLVIWLFLGALSTFLLTAFSSTNILIDFLLVLFFGTSIGLGLPSCLSYFANSTSIENRGLMSGVIWSAVGIAVLAFAFLISILGMFESIIIMTVWRLFGSVVFLFLNKPSKKSELTKTPSYLQLIRKRELLLYILPLVMFTVINSAEMPMLEKFFGTEIFAFAELAEFALIGLFAIIGGILADIAGRKRVVIAGFVMIGIEYAVMSILSSSSTALYLFITIDGITWGLLFSVCLTVIWGDLGQNYEKEKFYTLGGVPFLLAGLLSVLIKPYVQNISTATAFTLASFFLFMSVIPLMYAPETLPEKSMKDRELKSYLEKAQKFAEKETEKYQPQKAKAKQEETEEKEGDKEKNQKENEEAIKLAEKYY